jgi:hypothetical protein
LGRGVELRFGWGCLALLAGIFAYLSPDTGAHAAASSAHHAPKPLLVAIIDSGVAKTPELQDVLVAEYDFGASPARPAFQPRYDHGTMVATILEREARQPIRIVSMRIDDTLGCPGDLNPPCQRDVAPIVAAIRKAIKLRVSAINISLSLKDDPLLVDAVRDAARSGIRVVMAAGNEGQDRPANLGMARAGYPNTVLVGALDAKGQPWKSTNMPQADTTGYRYAWQWGVDVPTIMADGSEAIATGTSFAVPIETAKLLTEPKAKTLALSS